MNLQAAINNQASATLNLASATAHAVKICSTKATSLALRSSAKTLDIIGKITILAVPVWIGLLGYDAQAWIMEKPPLWSSFNTCNGTNATLLYNAKTFMNYNTTENSQDNCTSFLEDKKSSIAQQVIIITAAVFSAPIFALICFKARNGLRLADEKLTGK